MKVVVFGDTHLTKYFNKRKFNAIVNAIEGADKVIINGDFWDHNFITFDDFVNSRWKVLFPILLSKKSIYIHGNHDKKEYCDERVSLFSVNQVDSLRIALGNYNFHIEHGHRIDPHLMDKNPWLANKFTAGIGLLFHVLEVLLLGRRFFSHGRVIDRNKKLKMWASENLLKNEILICSHTHVPEIDLSSRFVATGAMFLGYAHCVSLEDNKISILEQHY